MKSDDVTIVRIYLTEGSRRVKSLMTYLHDESKVRGVTVFRGITGFGKSGHVHSSTLIDMSLDLPVVIEFFDQPERAAAVIDHLDTLIEPGHIVFWSARVNGPN
ncbi:MAG: DUF190 domain-containing protein [Gammaproteobacteria bacterium]|nr:DUF190 domain-containing protein [Gammaproteobacteria bacterium]NIR85790.1 DUF190 domain-containing protein [Gammaproteobacteria bacterium]NIR90544.1 DUF190 domain-containing protein [Gammaproteobacteria bacterium]NIU06925.1 DUF190 domain-containing protein [Gammaproteobacteria bacterium]NIV53855.1 DUF190 domain-containing protein [Gammaproteobacteria bacterium]